MRARAVHTCALTCGVEFSLSLGTHRIATSFFVASSPSLGPWRTNCGRLDGGFVPWQCLSEVVLRHSGARCKRRFAGCALWLPCVRLHFREAVTMIMSYLRMRADPLDSLDCSTFGRGCAVLAALWGAAARGGTG